MTAPPHDAGRDPQQTIAELQRKLDEAHAELAGRNSAYSERIAHQAAANDVLKVMSDSPGDPRPVFDLIATRARDLCDAYGVTVYEFDGELVHYRVATGVSDDPEVRKAFAAKYPMPPTRDMFPHRAILDRKLIRIDDLKSEPGLNPIYQTFAVGSAVALPMMRGDVAIGALGMGSRERGGFTDSQIELLKTFADQAAIAIENARLFNAVQERTRDLEESLQFQTASAEVLRVISRSPDRLQPVFDVIVETSRELCRAQASTILMLREGRFYVVAFAGVRTELLQYMTDHPIGIDQKGSALARAAREKRTVHIPNTHEDPEFGEGSIISVGEARATLTVPLLRDGQVIGGITLRQSHQTPFSQHQIEAIKSFADQAVIAISNVGLFEEVQQRTRDLSEALIYQTGSGNILKVIASSPTDVGPALKAIVDSACEICDAYDCAVLLKDGEHLVVSAHHGPIPFSFEKWPINRQWVSGRAVVDKAPQHVHDLFGPEGDGFPEARENARHMGRRTVLSVPLMREGDVIGAILLRRIEVHPFNDKQIELLKSFADQAVIAISNVRLFEQVQQRTRELSKSLDDLRTAQDRLIQTEKLASLGQLTAGIAHEIKNPLNFVNNFSALSVELTDELNYVLRQAELVETIRKETDELIGMLKDNLSKIVQHGKRADSIVKNMLLHSREGSREQRLAEINALVEESLNLAYHGARAEKSGFEITLQRDLDVNAGMVEVFPQEVSRALLNLISNGFYAATKRKTENGAAGVEPTVLATTKDLGSSVEIRIRDNGTGIPPEVREKIFNPFFTTKPTGEGTGLGLSMTHDIIVKQHGGRIDVETQLGEFTEFIVTLPRNTRAGVG